MVKDNKFIVKIKNHFSKEWIWRLFVILQTIGLIGIIYLFDTASIELRMLHENLFNWYIVFFLLSPYFISKSISWVSNGTKNG